jgi:hypothetical protein
MTGVPSTVGTPFLLNRHPFKGMGDCIFPWATMKGPWISVQCSGWNSLYCRATGLVLQQGFDGDGTKRGVAAVHVEAEAPPGREVGTDAAYKGMAGVVSAKPGRFLFRLLDHLLDRQPTDKEAVLPESAHLSGRNFHREPAPGRPAGSGRGEEPPTPPPEGDVHGYLRPPGAVEDGVEAYGLALKGHGVLSARGLLDFRDPDVVESEPDTLVDVARRVGVRAVGNVEAYIPV